MLMKINKSNFYRILFIVVLLSQIYLPSFKANVFFQIFVFCIYIYLEKISFTLSFLKAIFPLLLLFLIGFLGFIVFENPIGFVLKDIFHFIKPIQALLIGYFFFKTINDVKLFYKTIVITAFISAIIHILIIVFLVDFSRGTIHAIRDFTKDNFLEMIAIFLLHYYKIYYKQDLFDSKKNYNLIFIVILISCILYFSRTMMVGAVVIYFSMKGYTKITQTSIKIISFSIIAVMLLYVYLFSIIIHRNAKGLDSFLYKIKNAPTELFKSKIDRENHEQLWDHWRGYEVNRAFALMQEKPVSYVTGTGYGSLVNLKFKAPLTSEKEKGMKFISELHNGYMYVFYKTGILGLLFYLFMIIQFYRRIYKSNSLESVSISALGIFYLFTSFAITGLYNASDTTVFILGAFLFLETQKNRLN